MDVCLIYPTAEQEMGIWPPLGLAYIAAALERRGHRVEIIDRGRLGRQGRDVDEETLAVLERMRPQLIGITATTPLIPDAYRSARLARSLLPGAQIALGGTHASILSEGSLMECEALDFVCRHEGELTLEEIAAGKEMPQVVGVTYRERNGDLRATSDRPPLPDLDALPLPARHLLDMDYYLRDTYQVIRGVELRATHLLTARGCSFKCSFCAGQAVFGPSVRFHSTQRVLEEIRHLVEDYRVEGIYFAEDMFLSHRKRARDLCHALLESGLSRRLSWCAQLRADCVDEEILHLMKRAGCIQVEYGFESGSPRVLKILKKQATVQQSLRAAALTRKVGLRLLADIIVGVLGETRDDLLQTFAFLREIRPDEIGFNRYIPLPGSELFGLLQAQGWVAPDWSGYRVDSSLHNFTKMHPQEFQELYTSFLQGFVLPTNIRGYLRYNLPRRPGIFLRRVARNPLSVLNSAGKLVWTAVASEGSQAFERLRKKLSLLHSRWNIEIALRYLPLVNEIRKRRAAPLQVLEVGSGCMGISPYLGTGMPVVGVDVKFVGRIVEGLRPVRASATRLPFKDGQFGFVVAADVLEHLPANIRVEAIEEMLRVTQGKVLLAVPTGAKAMEQDLLLDQVYQKIHGQRYPFFADHISYGLPTVQDVTEVIKKAAARKKLMVEISKYPNTNLRIRYWMMRLWMSKNRMIAASYLLLGILKYLRKLLDFSDCYRQIFIITVGRPIGKDIVDPVLPLSPQVYYEKE